MWGVMNHIINLEDKAIALEEQDRFIVGEINQLIRYRNNIEKNIANISAAISDKESSLSNKMDYNSRNSSEIREKEVEIENIAKKARMISAGSTFLALLDYGLISGTAASVSVVALAKKTEELRERIAYLENDKYSYSEISDLKEQISKLSSRIFECHQMYYDLAHEISRRGKNHIYRVMVDKTLNDEAIKISKQLAKCADNSGTNIDKVIKVGGRNVLAFATAELNREILDAAIGWARAERGKFNVSPEELAFRQFINQVVIPNQDYFEILASKYDDLHKTGREGYPKLEILKQKPVSLSGRRQIIAKEAEPETEEEKILKQKQKEAEKTAEEKIPVLDFSNIAIHSESTKENLLLAVNESKKQIATIDDVFASISKEVAKLIEDSEKAKIKVTPREQQFKQDTAHNKNLDDKIDALEFDIHVKDTANNESKASRFTTAVGLSIAARLGKHIAKSAAAGAAAGSVIPARQELLLVLLVEDYMAS